MGPARLVLRGLLYYWRTHVAVLLGVATAVAVLAGALLVGDSVRGSLRALVLQRLGATDLVVASAGFFHTDLAERLQQSEAFHETFRAATPLVVIDGFVTEQESGRRAYNVRVYGVDDRFWRFHGIASHRGPEDRRALLSPALADQIGARTGEAVLVRVQRPSAIPIESLHGRKDDLGRTMRLTVQAIVSPSALGEFSLEPQQGSIRSVFVPLSRLQRELEIDDRVNMLLVSLASNRRADAANVLEQIVRKAADVDDVGVSVRVLEGRRGIAVGSDAGLLNDGQLAAARKALADTGLVGQPVFTYLANTMKRGDREIPYSLITAVDLRTVDPEAAGTPARMPASDAPPPIVLNEWAARELGARAGDALSIEYYVWEEPGRLATRGADFTVSGVIPVNGADRDLTPTLPGISDSPSLADWDPPFPIDLGRIRPVDEAYWNQYRTTPKAFIPLETGQRLWGSRYGSVTTLNVRSKDGESPSSLRERFVGHLRTVLDPLAAGLAVRPVRDEGIAASRGATDFGEYFTYFSFFLVVAALLLAALFFKLDIEQRMKEVGLLRAVGFSPQSVRRLFLAEGLLLSVVGSGVGALWAIGYARLLMIALRTWWVDAVGTTALTLHVTGVSLAAGTAGGIAAAAGCIWWTLHSLAHVSERSLLAGQPSTGGDGKRHASARTFGYGAGVLALVGGALLFAAAAGRLDGVGAFFGAGMSFLGAALCLFAAALRMPPRKALGGRGWRALSRLGFRSATFRPGRSVLSATVIAAATFIIISVGAFRRDHTVANDDPRSGSGGYALLVESLVPVVHDPNTDEGRSALNLFDLDKAARFEPFRLLPGDDASCLNLYEPRNPRILAPTDSFLASGRFAFQSSLGATAAERANPWLLLNRADMGDAIPVIADANSLTHVLHRKLGEDLVIPHGAGHIRLRLVAALRDSLFQGELLMSQTNFRKLFPEQEGYRFFLVDVPREGAPGAARQIQDGFDDIGAEVIGTGERIAQFHKVENTYLSTFQTLGGLGLLLGTVGLATVVLRNVLERRRELALLAAVGYRRQHFLLTIVAENVVLLAGGLAIGAVCAGLAVAPAVAERGGRIPLTSGVGLLLFAVFVTGLLSSIVATRVATKGSLLESLRSE